MPGVVSRPVRPARGKLGRASKHASASITSFGRVSKVQTTVGKEAIQKAAAIEAPRTSIEIILPSIKKRKASADDEDTQITATQNATSAKKARRDETLVSVVTTQTKEPRKKKTVTFNLPEDTSEASAPISSKRKRTTDSEKRPLAESSEAEQPEDLLERLNLQSSPIRKRSKTSSLKSKYDADLDLPRELLDILDMHAAFLKTLTLHYVHNSLSTPVDILAIGPSITQAWGKRKVTIEDIRRCVGVLGWTQEKGTKPAVPYFLFDLGRGKICIELQNPSNGHLREDKVKMDFEANLRALWALRSDTNLAAFVSSLPLAPIRACPKPSPLLSRGSRALEELKNGVVRKQQEQAAKAQAVPTTHADGTKMSLLDRIRYKELLQSQSAQGPTSEELQRRAALQKASDIAAVIGMLTTATSTGQARVSFTMAAVLSKLKDSLRVPVSAEEGAGCVKLLASEIAPQWLRVVTIGGREHVVVQTAFQPSKAGIEGKVKALSA